MKRIRSRPRLSKLSDDSLVYVGTDNDGNAYICAEPLMYIRTGNEPLREPKRMTFGEFKKLPNVDPFYREHYGAGSEG